MIHIADAQDALLGLRVFTQMHKRGLSIPQLAKQARVPLSTVQKICAGKSKQPSVWTIWALAQVLGGSVDALLTGDDSRQG